MRLNWPFARAASADPSTAGRTLSDLAREAQSQSTLTYRNRVRAKAKAMREEMGLPASDLLEPR